MSHLARARQFRAMTDYLDLALVFDPATLAADLALGADGDLVLDETPVTPMLVSLGSDRRARADDELPTGISEINAPSSFIERRGWCGDAFDGQNRFIGSRLWLLDRAKETELTRRLAEEWAREALDWVQITTGAAASVSATWLRRGILGLTCSVGDTTIETRLAGAQGAG